MIFCPRATSLLLQWWCIFILYTQRTDCASFFSNAEPATAAGVLSLCGESGETSEQYVSDKGPTSSVLLALRPEHGKASPSSATSCKRQYRAPDAYNFFVRMQRVPAVGSRSSASRKYNGNKSSNSTHSCPLTISQSANGEVLPSWRLDPCLLETAGTLEEPMRLMQGKLNIVWNHDGNAPNYRLQITVVGQGAVCLERDKHSCLEYVGMPLLCIARELVCDGLPNCPPLGTEVSDENEAMCVKHRQQEYSENPVQSVFRQYIQNTIKSFFGGEPKELPSKPAFGEVDIGLEQKFGALYPPVSSPFPPPATEPTVQPPKKHRSSLTGLSKYGPWGYLFLGMLICGGALLICGLWECCCRSHKPETDSTDDSLPDQVPSFLQTSPPTGDSGRQGMAAGDGPATHNLPHYGELDPPPAYSVLFPTQKPSDSGNELPVTGETAQTNSPSISDSNNSRGESDGHPRVADEEGLVVAGEAPPSPLSSSSVAESL
ncbi:uncharacterized protein LOC128301718 [Anopheles moucheti]|uniref:uncharacterized protein LOC128301718 n=1 Tax=Anopheles moucheti TaxID=186751 RepID=UPI0022F120BF|nr:uncharacterized protein LOC128301718 [Anopheles moucheti]